MKGYTLFQGKKERITNLHCQHFKKNSSPELLSQFQPNLAQIILDERDSLFTASPMLFFASFLFPLGAQQKLVGYD